MPLTEEQKRKLLEKFASPAGAGAMGQMAPEAAAGGALGNTVGNAMSPEVLKKLRDAGLGGAFGAAPAADDTTGMEKLAPGQSLMPDRQLMPGQEGVIPAQPAPMEQTPEQMMGPRPTDQEYALPPEQMMAGIDPEEEKRKKARALALQGLARGQAGEGQPLTSGEPPIMEG